MKNLSELTTEKANKSHLSLWFLGAAAFMVIADARVINPLLHIIANEFGTGVGSAGIIISAYTIPYGLFQLVYGPLGDRIGKLKVMTAAMVAFAVGTAACALAPSIGMLVSLQSVVCGHRLYVGGFWSRRVNLQQHGEVDGPGYVAFITAGVAIALLSLWLAIQWRSDIPPKNLVV